MKIQDADRNDQRKASINKIEWLSRLSFFIFLTKMNNFLSLDQRQSPQKSPHTQAQGSPQARSLGAEMSENVANLVFKPSLPQLCLSEMISPQTAYLIENHLLLGTSVTQIKRALLRNEINKEAVKLKLDRKVAATGLYYIDLFLSKGGIIQLHDLYDYGVAALDLANKLLTNVQINISQTAFPLATINKIQTQLSMRLQFKLRPVTYVHLIDQLIYLWNTFSAQYSELWAYQSQNTKFALNKLIYGPKKIYQLMQTTLYLIRSFDFSLLDLVIEVFRDILDSDYKIVTASPKPIEDEVIINFWENPEQVSFKQRQQSLIGLSFEKIFKKFMANIEKCCEGISVQSQKRQEIRQFVRKVRQQLFKQNYPTEQGNQSDGYWQSLNRRSMSTTKLIIANCQKERKNSIETAQI